MSDAMAHRGGWNLWGGFWATSLGTLAGRVLGLVRDVTTAALLGLGEGGVMDALVVALRIPNLARRVLGEGALAASFLPVFSAQFQRDPRRAWQLTSAVIVWLAGLSALIVLAGEGVCALVLVAQGSAGPSGRLAGLTAVMLPYLGLVCVSAQLSAALQALLRFRLPALVPILLNVCWLAAAWLVAPWLAPDKLAQAYAIAVAVVVSGALQVFVQWRALARLGFRFDYDWKQSRAALGSVAWSMLPIGLGLAVTQINTLLDSLIAWGFSAEIGAPRTIAWLGGNVVYPLQSGAAAAIYYGERFYQLPVGLLGVAIATVAYPLLSRHAARGERDRISHDLTLALRLVCFAALPASVGMILLAEPVVRLFFEHGQFTAEDTTRTARMIACYATGAWAYSAIPVLVRGYYALGQRAFPAKVGLLTVALNLVLNLTFIWPLAERGLAVATALAAAVQVVLLSSQLARFGSPLAWNELLPSLAKCGACVLVMAALVEVLARAIPAAADASLAEQAGRLAFLIGLGAGTYLATARLLGMDELRLLLVRPADTGRLSSVEQ